jgi:large subunit ribosomal protein L16
MLYPKKVKYRRWQTGRKSEEKLNASVSTRGTDIQFGSFAVKATTAARVNSRQIESARKVVSRTVGKLGQYWIRIFPDRPITKKSAAPMGKGKGGPEGFCFEVTPGRIIFEVDNVPEAVAREALRKAGAKLPVKVKIVAKREIA